MLYEKLEKKSYVRLLAVLAENEINAGLTIEQIITRAKEKFDKNCSQDVAKKILWYLRSIDMIYSLQNRWLCREEGLNKYRIIKASRPHLLEKTLTPETWMHA